MTPTAPSPSPGRPRVTFTGDGCADLPALVDEASGVVVTLWKLDPDEARVLAGQIVGELLSGEPGTVFDAGAIAFRLLERMRVRLEVYAGGAPLQPVRVVCEAGSR